MSESKEEMDYDYTQPQEPEVEQPVGAAATEKQSVDAEDEDEEGEIKSNDDVNDNDNSGTTSESGASDPPKPAAPEKNTEDDVAGEESSPKTTPDADADEPNEPDDEKESESAMNVDVDTNTKDADVDVDQEQTKESEVESKVGEEGDTTNQEDNTDAQYEKSYSTRGRAGATTDTASEPLERLARDALSDFAKEKETPISAGASFLSDALTEEERRTRTRYLPEVEGMHVLRKNEIKGDLALARSIQSSSGAAGTLATSKAKAKRAREEDEMEGVEEEGVAPSEDDRTSSDISRLGAKTSESGTSAVIVPSMAFVAPPASSNGDGASAGSKRDKPLPHEVDSVTAFNPPRPPESIGAKKKHRMLRWERRPADIEVDLSNYRKTVNRTREELKNAESERDRIETAENHLRRHFFNHLKCLNEEWVQLNEELAVAHQDCVNAADLLTSRTRSRGAGKGSYAMKDVLGVLRSRGAEIDEKGLSLDNAPSLATESNIPGVGGVGARSCKDWDNSTVIAPGKVGAAWIMPGDKIKSPYGVGTVVAVYSAAGLDVKEAPHADLKIKTSVAKAPSRSDSKDISDTPMPDADSAKSESKEMESKSGAGPKSDDSVSGTKKQRQAAKKKSSEAPGSKTSLENMLAPRVAVRMPYGIGFFNLDACVSMEDASRYSDSRLASRWKGMVETAATFGATLDIEAMANIPAVEYAGDAMDTSGTAVVDEMTGIVEDTRPTKKGGTPRLVPFGSGLLPTASGRGSLVANIGLVELDSELNLALSEGAGATGLPDNTGVPKDVRTIEVKRQEYLDLQARVLQVRNELYRQRRNRMLNERTFAATQERSARVEALVSEMRSDLKSLKSRLDDEIRELGISERQAENLLTSFYLSLDSRLSGQASPPKRPRKHHSDVDVNDDDDMEEEVMESILPEKGSSKQ
jgi:hypothetical protein